MAEIKELDLLLLRVKRSVLVWLRRDILSMSFMSCLLNLLITLLVCSRRGRRISRESIGIGMMGREEGGEEGEMETEEGGEEEEKATEEGGEEEEMGTELMGREVGIEEEGMEKEVDIEEVEMVKEVLTKSLIKNLR